MIRSVGSYVSPYVRKVLACLNLKGLAYEIDPIRRGAGDPKSNARGASGARAWTE